MFSLLTLYINPMFIFIVVLDDTYVGGKIKFPFGKIKLP